MKVIALCQAYNEAMFIHQSLSWAYEVCDQIILTEGCLTPFSNQTRRSQDRTRTTIKCFIETYDRQDKIKYYDAFIADPAPRNREEYEGMNKNFMLKKSDVEHGDLIFILDVDEFWDPNRFNSIVKRFKNNDKIVHVPVQEHQFAYGLNLCFNAEHNGRFMRFLSGSKFGATNHFVHPGGTDVTKDYSCLALRDETQMCHLCWSKHPAFIKQKVESFQRPSFTAWYNNVYLQYPIIGTEVYEINKRIPPYHGPGFAEGQHERLRTFKGILPPVLRNMRLNWTGQIMTWKEELKI